MVFGGRSGEHEVSLLSARSVLAALDPARFEVVPMAITREGRWLLPADPQRSLGAGPAASGGTSIAVVPGDERALAPADPAGGAAPGRLDVVFPVLHGPNGEDGTIQGLLELAGLPYVGAGVLGSALGMDKVAQKDVFVRHGLPVVDYVPLRRRRLLEDPAGTAAAVVQRLGLPCFVKPANMGSSVGISKAHSEPELLRALHVAARYDTRLICERAVADRRELECGVLGNEQPQASVVGEVVPRHEFYDYEAKYTEGQAELIVPADLPPGVADRVRALALRAFEVLDCAGMARVDFFLAGTGPEGVLINEVNTIPGFTATSMYPRLWGASGLPYGRLLARLIELALERHAQRNAPPESPPG